MSRTGGASSKNETFKLGYLLSDLNRRKQLFQIALTRKDPVHRLDEKDITMFEKLLPDYKKAYEETKKEYEDAIKAYNLAANATDSTEKELTFEGKK